MTLIIGMECRDGLLFCADREEGTELGGKRSVSKLYEARGKEWDIVLGTSGSGPLSDKAARRIIDAARTQKGFFGNPDGAIEEILKKIYDQYVFPYDKKIQADRGISLLVGIRNSKSKKVLLYKTFDEIVKAEDLYACAGVGQDVANYFLDRLYDTGLNIGESTMLAIFACRESKASVGSVGRETELVQFYNTASHRMLISETFEGKAIPHLGDCMKHFWKENP